MAVPPKGTSLASSSAPSSPLQPVRRELCLSACPGPDCNECPIPAQTLPSGLGDAKSVPPGFLEPFRCCVLRTAKEDLWDLGLSSHLAPYPSIILRFGSFWGKEGLVACISKLGRRVGASQGQGNWVSVFESRLLPDLGFIISRGFCLKGWEGAACV